MQYFSDSFSEARARFLEAAAVAKATVTSHRLKSTDDLTIDVAVLQQRDWKSEPRNLVVSSGLHGVEGYLGSAVQLALLEHFQRDGLPENIRLVLIHAMNPYGFQHGRRFDHENIDLNRNFHTDLNRITPSGYSRLNQFLNPATPSGRWEFYYLRAIWNILRYGMPDLKVSVVGGQYDYPLGIFYGGRESSEIKNIVEDNIDLWVGDIRLTAHIDLHSGLGAYGDCKLLVNEEPGSANWSWYGNAFGSSNVESLKSDVGTGYNVSGSMGEWLQQYFNDRQYYFAGAEFGTYGPVRVLGAIRAENRAHHYSEPDSRAFKNSKAELRECFCPRSSTWRDKVIATSLEIVSNVVSQLECKRI